MFLGDFATINKAGIDENDTGTIKHAEILCEIRATSTHS